MIATLRKCGMYALISTCLFYSNGSQLFFHSFSFIFIHFQTPKISSSTKNLLHPSRKKSEIKFFDNFFDSIYVFAECDKKVLKHQKILVTSSIEFKNDVLVQCFLIQHHGRMAFFYPSVTTTTTPTTHVTMKKKKFLSNKINRKS